MGQKRNKIKDTFTRILEKTRDSKFLVNCSSISDYQMMVASSNLAKFLRKENLDVRSAMSKRMYLSSFIQEVVASFEIEYGTSLPMLHFGHNTGKIKNTFEKVYIPSIKWWFSAKEICEYIIIPYANFLYRKERKNVLYKLMDKWIMEGLFSLKS